MVKTKKGKKRRDYPDRDTFCRIWQEARNVAEVCEKTGMEPASAMAMASYYRKEIPLKKFRQGRPSRSTTSVEDLKVSLGLDRDEVPKDENLQKVLRELRVILAVLRFVESE